MEDPFVFYRLESPSDGELTLALDRTMPAIPGRGYAPSYAFSMRTTVGGISVGRLSLRVGYVEGISRGNPLWHKLCKPPPSNENIRYGGHIGYEVFPAYRGHRYALKACRLVLPLARRHGISPLIITCNPDNMASRRTIELLGATLLETVALPSHNEMYALGERVKCIYTLPL